MKKRWFTNGKRIIQNGKQVLCDDCPCECPPFEGRSIIYVDKHATGIEDGSSWEDAYTDIQTALDAHSRSEIQVKGYGDSDCYPAGITLPECAYLKGIDDVWLDGEDMVEFGCVGDYISSKVDSINIKRCYSRGYMYINSVSNSTVKKMYYDGSISSYAFYYCDNLDNCTALDNEYSNFAYCLNMNGCTVIGNRVTAVYAIPGGIYTGCVVRDSNIRSGYAGNSFFSRLGGATFNNCHAYNNEIVGFSNYNPDSGNKDVYIDCVSHDNSTGFVAIDSTFTNCVAYNNQFCGFLPASTYKPDNTYINCSEYNNCLGGRSDCTPSDPSYRCDEV